MINQPDARDVIKSIFIFIFIFIPFVLVGCGTTLTLDGSVCGQPIKVTIIDHKDRSGFVGEVTCPDGGKVLIQSTDSSVSAVIGAVEAIVPAFGKAAGEAARAAAGAP